MKTLIGLLIASALSGCAVVSHEQVTSTPVVQTGTVHKFVCNMMSPFQECERSAAKFCPQGYETIENSNEFHWFEPSGRTKTVRCTNNGLFAND
jgi:hypothetical protein